MKAESTIRREIGRLKRLAESKSYSEPGRMIAYEAYHALRWAIEDVQFTPYGEISRYQQAAEAGKEE